MDNQKVLIADDHALIRDGVRHCFTQFEENYELLEAASAEDVRRTLASVADINFMILDIYLPDANGLDLLGELCISHPDIVYVVLSASDEPELVRKAIDWGASGYIPKSMSPQIMVSALSIVLRGGMYIPPSMLRQPTQRGMGPEGISFSCTRESEQQGNGLTRRQQDVLFHIAEGKQNKQIADDLGLSEHTVKVHVRGLFRILGVSNRTQAVNVARKSGIIPLN